MPIVQAQILEGYSGAEKARLLEALTNAIRFVVPAADDAITVLIQEYPADAYARGGQTRRPAPARPEPAEIVRRYLGAMEARDLDLAATMLGADFQMTFPGPTTMRTLPELVAWSKDRYRFVTKTYDAFEAFHHAGVQVVYARGTLSGEWPDGRAFAGIRFIDRFEMTGDQITRQDVWNDLAEVRGT